MTHLVAEITGQSLDSVKPYEVMRHMVAWQDEPPLLLQIRNLLVQLITLTGSVNGHKINPSDLIPRRISQEEKLEQDRQNMIAWAAKHNATLKE